ncbi:MAG: biotin/lipoyl-binding protein [bacterium]|jgi:biotin carboxyl carrier protein|nr:biotin/lipoyl-binding protein [candidate division KSB1 bacterium]MDH7559807.1 biotin/lipoyl-binding protein [bacterium]
MKEKKLVLEIEGREYTVVISDFGPQEATIAVDGKPYKVALKDLGSEQLAEVRPAPAPPPSALEPQVPVFAPAKRVAPGSPIHRPKTVGSDYAIAAPLPGLILEILVRDGDVVRRGQAVAILEAMKMENEVTSQTEGVVIDVRFREGDSVNQGDVLVLLKPVEG